MLNKYEMILCEVLDCGYLDIKMLEDVKEDLIQRGIEYVVHDLGDSLHINNLMYGIFQIALNDFQEDINKKIEYLEDVLENEEDEKEHHRISEVIDVLKDLDVYEHFESYHNYMDTSIWFTGSEELEEILKDDCKFALTRFYENTGFSLID